jgi:hypothetical protein
MASMLDTALAHSHFVPRPCLDLPTQGRTGTAADERLRIDDWLTDPAQVGPWLADQWRAFLGAPRWRVLPAREIGLELVLILFQSPDRAPSDEPRAETRESDLAALLGADEDQLPSRTSIFAVRSRDRALLEPDYRRILPSIDGPDAARFVELARTGADEALREVLRGWRFRTVTGSAPFFLHRDAGAFGTAAEGFQNAARSLIQRARDYHGLHRVKATAALVHAPLREARLFRQARRTLLDGLDAGALRHLRRTGAAMDGRTYAYLVGCPDRRAWREQAVAAYPGLVSILLDERLEQVIDRGEPLTPWLAQRLRVPAGTVRHFKHVPARQLRWPLPAGYRDHRDLITTTAAMLAVTPTPRRPSTRAAWGELLRSALEIRPLHACFERLRHEAREAFESGPLRQFVRLALARRVAVLYPPGPRRANPWIGLGNVGDTFRAIFEYANDRGVPFERIDLALARLKVAEWVRIDVAWHEAVAEFEELGPLAGMALDENGGLTWPALAAPCRFGDLRLLPLVTAESLRAEGRSMKHCVASYAVRCLFERTHLFSIRDARGQRLATLEVDVVRDPTGRFRARLAQLRGPANAAPSTECINAAHLLLTTLGRLPQQQFRAVDDALLKRLARRTEIEAACEQPRRAYAVTRALPDQLLALLGHAR